MDEKSDVADAFQAATGVERAIFIMMVDHGWLSEWR